METKDINHNSDNLSTNYLLRLSFNIGSSAMDNNNNNNNGLSDNGTDISSDTSIEYAIDWSEDTGDGNDFGDLDNLFNSSSNILTITRQSVRRLDEQETVRQIGEGVVVTEGTERRVALINDDSTVKLLTSYDAPPEFDGKGGYSEWKRELDIWKESTLVPQEKQAGQVLRYLKGQAKDVVLTLENQEILCKDGIKNMLRALDTHYKSPKYDSKLRKLSDFSDTKRAPDEDISEFIIKFEKLFKLAKNSQVAPNAELKPLLLIRNSNLTKNELSLVLAALGVKFSYQNVTEILKRVIKTSKEGDTEAEVLKTRIKKDSDRSLSKNLIKKDLKCSYCGKKGHVIDKCFTRYDDQNYCNYCSLKGHKFRECKKRKLNPMHVKILKGASMKKVKSTKNIGEFNEAILDLGATVNVAGREWLKRYLKKNNMKLPEKMPTDITCVFGDNYKISSMFCAYFPIFLGGKKVILPVEILEGDMQFILGAPSMISMGMILHLKEKLCIITSLNMKVPIMQNPDKHLTVCIRPTPSEGHHSNVRLLTDHSPNVKKLHLQLSHPSSDALWKFIQNSKKYKNSGIKRKSIDRVVEDCSVCQNNQVPDLRPIVTLDKALYFNHTVAMDMFELNGKVFLHAIDVFSRFSQVKMTNTKKPQVVLNAFLIM